MCQPSAITDNNMPPSAILGTYHHFRNFIIKTIYSGDYLVFPFDDYPVYLQVILLHFVEVIC